MVVVAARKANTPPVLASSVADTVARVVAFRAKKALQTRLVVNGSLLEPCCHVEADLEERVDLAGARRRVEVENAEFAAPPGSPPLRAIQIGSATTVARLVDIRIAVNNISVTKAIVLDEAARAYCRALCSR